MSSELTEDNSTAKISGDISGGMFGLNRHTVTLILDWMIIFSLAILMGTIYIPKMIWAEESNFEREAHRRMTIINDAEEFYNTLTGEYTTDGEFLFQIVSQVHDSLIADSTFINQQIVKVAGMPHTINIPVAMAFQMDTTFSVGRQIRVEMLDTTYTITLRNDDGGQDTLYIDGVRGLRRIQNDDPDFLAVIGKDVGSHKEVLTEYDLYRFFLTSNLLVSEADGQIFSLAINPVTNEFSVTSPIDGEYVESRYFFFRFRAINHGTIVGGEPSWRVQ